MIKNFTTSILMFLAAVVCVAQGTGDIGTANQFKYTDVLPPSPDQAKLNTFTRPDVGKISGTAQFHLPITEISAGGVSIPVSVSYSSNGVKVDDISSRAGTDFHLQAGGSINRVIMGKDDTNDPYLAPPSLSPLDTSFLHYLERVSATGNLGRSFDSQPDVYSYNVSGISGKFIIDRYNNVINIPKSKNKITMTNYGTSTWTFTLTDTQGNQYIFGGSGYLETSKSTSSCGRDHSAAAPTAWFLKQIIAYNGDTMTLTYTAVTFNYDRGVNQTIYYQTPAQLTFPANGTTCKCPAYPQQVIGSCINYYNTSTYYLSQILSSRGDRVNFDYQTRQDGGDVLLTGVHKVYAPSIAEHYIFDYRNVHTTLMKPTGLAIQNTNNEYRYFLTSVRKFAADTIQLYRMTYHHPDLLPVRMSFSQDDWGYYNAKPNTTMLPIPTDTQQRDLFPQASADRSVDTVACKYGLLTSIQYPTGGYDSIVYDVNRVWEERTVYPTTLETLAIHQAGLAGSPNPDNSSTYNFTTLFEQKVYFSLVVTNQTGGAPINGTEASLIVLNSSGTQVKAVILFPGTNDDHPIGAQSVYSVYETFPAGVYSAYVSVKGNGISTADATIKWCKDPIQEIETNWAMGGVRVHSILNYSKTGVLQGMSRFGYHEINSSHSSAVTTDPINYTKSISYQQRCSALGEQPGEANFHCMTGLCEYIGVLSSPVNTIMSQEGNSVTYPTVLEYSDADGSNGFIEHKYLIENDERGVFMFGSSPIFTNMTNRSVNVHGKEICTSYYGKNGSGYYPLKKTNYYYSGVNTSVVTGLVVNQMFTLLMIYTTPTVNDCEIAGFEATRYNLFSPFTKLDSVVETDYTAAGAQYVKTVSYVMDTVNTYQVKSTLTRDSRGRQEEVLNYYSGMPSSIPGLASGQLAFMYTLKGQNKLTDLVYQRKNVNGAFAGSQRVMVDQFTPSNKIFTKDVRQYFVNETDGIGFTILSYDAAGNVTQRKKDDGTIESLMWDYSNSYPVAQILGSDLSQVAYTGCEQTSTGSWSITNGSFVTDTTAPTGSYVCSFSTAGTFMKSGLSTGSTYTVSFWYKTGTTATVSGASSTVTVPGKDGWTNAIATLTGATVATINVGTGGRVDDIRLHPIHAKMSTYTYLFGVGATSISDANNRITYYEYDSHHRLLNVRDYRGKLLKVNQYHYTSSNIN